jgi:hypothetical protein
MNRTATNPAALRPRQRTMARVAAVVIGLTLLTAGCSGGSSGSETTGGGGSGGSGTTKVTSGDTTDADKRLEYSACLREHGLDIKDAPPGEDGGGQTMQLDAGGADKADAAMKACAGKALGGPNGPKLSQAEKDKRLAFARCMRKNGVNVPDPVFDGGAAPAMRQPTTGPEKAKFAAALKTCDTSHG